MEKMISVINNNLRSVINGIKEHKFALENNLESIKKSMSLKVNEANGYKTDVEHARIIISNLENEISELEKDLSDLNDKFGAKDFKEILVAGNKEINAKIIEKRASINEQGQIIIALTEKAHVLKDELVKLRAKRVSTETSLEKTRILEKYFESRINEIIVYSEEHPEELVNFSIEKPQEELNIQENVDISSVIDGSIFEEIDEISTTGPDEDLIREVLSSGEIEEVVDSEIVVEEKNNTADIDLTMTTQLEDMISEAKAIIERNSNLMDEAKNNEIAKEVMETVHDEISYDEVSDDEDVIDIYVEDDDREINPDLIIHSEKRKPIVTLHTMSEPDDNLPEMPEVVEENIIVQEEVPEENDFVIDENVASESIFNKTDDKDFYENLRDCGIDPDTFSEEDLIALQNTFDKDTTIEFINVMRKYDISINNIYKNVTVLINVTPQNLDKILSLLKGTGAKNEDINYVFDRLDRVNINKLEQNCLTSATAHLSEVLLTAMPYEESDILDKLELSAKEQTLFKKQTNEADYRKFHMFPEIVMTNYNELKKFNINNLDECITKHPHRFTYNPTSFHAILDKYDVDDLIRCINKNAAVIDKL